MKDSTQPLMPVQVPVMAVVQQVLLVLARRYVMEHGNDVTVNFAEGFAELSGNGNPAFHITENGLACTIKFLSEVEMDLYAKAMEGGGQPIAG